MAARPKAKVSAKAKAVAYLARREHSQAELATKLARQGYGAAEIDHALQWLQGHQLQSDARFAQSLARRRAANYGNRAIGAELAQHGLNLRHGEESPKQPVGSLQSEVSSSQFGTQMLGQPSPTVPPEADRIFHWLQRRYTSKLQKGIALAEGESLDGQQLLQLKAKAYRALSARGFEQSHIEVGWRRFVDDFMGEQC